MIPLGTRGTALAGMFAAHGNPVSRAVLAARRGFSAEPLDPPAGRVSAGQEAPAVLGPIEDAGSQHGEDAVLVVTDQRGGKGQALHAVAARRS